MLNKKGKKVTYPPRNAPTGFRRGTAVAEAAAISMRKDEVWKLRTARNEGKEDAGRADRARKDGAKTREAIGLDGQRVKRVKRGRLNDAMLKAGRWK